MLYSRAILLQIHTWSRYPLKSLSGRRGRAVKCALESRLVALVRSFGDRVLGFRVTWRVKGTALARVWDDIVRRRHLCDEAVGDSLVFIFPLATMLTFTSAVGKLNVRVLWHHHMLLQVISQSYCQVFVKSYNFVFEKIDKEGSPREK